MTEESCFGVSRTKEQDGTVKRKYRASETEGNWLLGNHCPQLVLPPAPGRVQEREVPWVSGALRDHNYLSPSSTGRNPDTDAIIG